jgi:septal ring factor EnvC (AmiA/AmiB activator)
MEYIRMTTQGITIEKFTLSWLQLLAAAFAVGGFVYTSASTYARVVEIEARQKATISKYVPIVERLDREEASKSINLDKLNESIIQLNSILSAMQAVRAYEQEDRAKLEKRIEALSQDINSLKVQIGSFRIG